MGNRAVVVFKDQERVSPGIYVHWSGGNIVGWLKEAAPTLRAGDVSYAAARFCGFCHHNIQGGLSLGLLDAPEDLKPETLRHYSHGDAGVFVVDVKTGLVENFDGIEGEGAPKEPFTIKFGTF
jgi:hypothetical protein